MIARLPLSDAEKAEAVRRLLGARGEGEGQNAEASGVDRPR